MSKPPRLSRRWLTPLAALLLACAGTGCGAGKPQDPPAPKSVLDHFEMGLGNRRVSLQLAVTDPEQERGLMQRPDLKGSDGMIFVYPSPRRMAFWMRNTPEPLDIGFLAEDGTVSEIYPLLPFDEKTVFSRSRQMKFAIEMPQGWYAANGVGPGSRLDLKALGEALKARGFEPEAFHLP